MNNVVLRDLGIEHAVTVYTLENISI